MRTRVIVVSLIAILGLTGCAADAPDDGTSAPPSSSTPSATPSPTPTIVPAVIPTDCATLVDTATYEATFGDAPLNDPSIAAYYPLGVLQPTEIAVDAPIEDVMTAATQLRCLWRDPNADITNLQVEIGTVDETLASGYLDGLALVGYTCDETLDGRRCAITRIEPQYQVEESDTLFLRDDVLVHVSQDNFPTNNLLAAIVDGIWAA